MSIQDLAAICALFTLIWFWLDSLRAREIALGICQAACAQKDLQLLDQTVALRRLILRSTRSGLRFRRIYRFDYSDEGLGRHTGNLVMLGLDLEELSFGLPSMTDEA